MQLCLGTAQLGMDYGIQGGKRINKTNAYKILDRAVQYGITTLDTAAMYGLAEEVLGDYILNNSIRTKFKIISKLCPNTLENVNEENYFKVIDSALSETIKKLNCDTLEGYLFHNPKYAYDEKRLRALNSLKQKGVVRNVGISIYHPSEALAAAESDFVDFIQVPYNALDIRLHNIGFFDLAKKNKKTVFARSPFLQGLLTMNVKDIPSNLSYSLDIVKQFQSITNDYGLSPLEACLAFIKSCISIDYLVFGVANIEQLDSIVYTFKQITSTENEFCNKIKQTFQNVDKRIINPSQWGT